jgi:hypothetical protein
MNPSNSIRVRIFLLVLFVLFSVSAVIAQNKGVVRGSVVDKNTQEPIIGANILVEGTDIGTSTEVDGSYRLEIPVGTVSLRVSFLGYTTLTKHNIQVTSGNVQIVNFELEASSVEMKEFTVTYDAGKSAVATDMTTPLSVSQLTTEEIKSNPGGSFDVSRVVQTLPGVGGSGGGAARNDIIIRGGAPNENVYYLDGIEIPVLNHFQTQGSSGGAQGILNVAFIEEVKLSSSAFDARYDNALSSTFVIRQREGNPEKISGNFRLSFTETVGTLEGPLGKKTNFLLSTRISYLDFLFKLIDLPIRPNFSDYQYKFTHRINDKTTLTAIGIGAIDKFTFGEVKNATPENEYIRRSQPIIGQWTYTTGFALKRLVNKGYYNIALSRNMFNNDIDRFEDAQYGNEAYRNFKLRSQEIENKLRFDINKFIDGWKISAGFVGQYVKYNTDLYNKFRNELTDSVGNVILPEGVVEFRSAIEFFRYGVFGQVSRNVLKEKLLISFGIRSDMNSFTATGNNPFKTLSPRLSFAYHVNPKLDLTATVGRYYKLPTYTTLGYRDEDGTLVNREMQYISSDHFVIGAQYLPKESLRFTVEGFYKLYSDYPVSVRNGFSLANTGSEFGAVGNEAVTSTGKGENYGFEVSVQQKLIKKVFYVVSYTFVRSFYSGSDQQMIVSSWDNQHLLSATLGYKFGKNWQIGAKLRFQGGNPYTPFDLMSSQQNYALLGTGVLDYAQINTLRLNNFSQLDFRIDKTYNFKKTALNVFIDIQNLLMAKQQFPPYYTFKRTADNSGFETTDGQPLRTDGSNGIPVILENYSQTVTPTFGFVFQF